MRDLSVCPSCRRDLVQPTDAEAISPTHWVIELWCPNCEWEDVGTFDQATADAYDLKLETAMSSMLRSLRRSERNSLASEADRFAAALAADAILPEDF